MEDIIQGQLQPVMVFYEKIREGRPLLLITRSELRDLTKKFC